MAEKYLTLKGAAEILSVSTRTLANLAMPGQISAYRLPSAAGAKSRYRFKLADLENFMAGNKLLAVNVTAKNVFNDNNARKARIDIKKIKKALSI